MSASRIVVRKNPLHYAPAFDLKVASPTFEGALKDLVALGGKGLF
jgi:hypothetical protein